MITAKSSLLDVAFLVCTQLEQSGITAVLTGGSAASYYAPNDYLSQDADFIITMSGASNVQDVMETLHFKRNGRIFVHAKTPFTVEFPSGPLAVGADLLSEWKTEEKGRLVLHVLSRTDSVRDRLCGYYFWDELQSLRVAVSVASSGPIDLDVIRSWSVRENMAAKYEEFERRLEKMP